MLPRLFIGQGLSEAGTQGIAHLPAGSLLTLPEGPARHIQVLRLQPGSQVCLFDGLGGEWTVTVAKMGRRDVEVRLANFKETCNALPIRVTLALGMPANDRMDAVVEKATELGVAAVQPLLAERSVLRLDGDRAAKKVGHWQGVAIAASEQCGRTDVPAIQPVMSLKQWLAKLPVDAQEPRALLSLREGQRIRDWLDCRMKAEQRAEQTLLFLSGPEGGLSEDEEALARAQGFKGVSLGPRVLRADTAPLMVMSLVAGLSSF